MLSLLEKLSSGWRQPHIGSVHVVHDETSSQLVECYLVNMEQYLVWTVDILKEDLHYIQVLQVWDILPQSGIPELSKQIDFFYRRYSADMLSRCKYKHYDGYTLLLIIYFIHGYIFHFQDAYRFTSWVNSFCDATLVSLGTPCFPFLELNFFFFMCFVQLIE